MLALAIFSAYKIVNEVSTDINRTPTIKRILLMSVLFPEYYSNWMYVYMHVFFILVMCLAGFMLFSLGVGKACHMKGR